jgi:uncharacterized protein YoxC
MRISLSAQPPPVPPTPPTSDLDAAKRRLEEEKLTLEIAALRRKWKLSDYFSGIVTLAIGAATLSIASQNHFFDVTSKVLEMKQESLKRDIANFETQKQSLVAEKNSLAQQVNGLQAKRDSLYGEVKDLRANVALTEIKTRMERLTGGVWSIDDSEVKAVFKIIENNKEKQTVVDYVKSIVDSPSYAPSLRASLCIPLSIVEPGGQWHSRMLQMAHEQIISMAKDTIDINNARNGAFLPFVQMLQQATLDEKTSVLKEIFSILENHSPLVNGNGQGAFLWPNPTRSLEYALIAMDMEATSRVPELWLGYVRYVIRTWRGSRPNIPYSQSSNSPQIEFELEPVAPQGAIMLAIQPPMRRLRVDRLTLTNCYLPTDFPVDCKQDPSTYDKAGKLVGSGIWYVQLHGDTPGIYSSWLATNKKLSALWTDPDLRVLSTSVALVRKAIHKEWITEDEIPN